MTPMTLEERARRYREVRTRLEVVTDKANRTLDYIQRVRRVLGEKRW